MKRQTLDRRNFFQTTAAMMALSSLPASRALAMANGKLRTAHIGVGGMGGADLGSIASHPAVEVAALCDIDSQRLSEVHARHPSAKTYVDYREMLIALGDTIDAVVVSTPDHTHAPASMLALNLNKPVYCQKPLTHEVFEARQLRKVAESKKLATQMGIQVHSAAPYRQAVRIIQDGVIGKVSQVHAWSNKNWGYDGADFQPTTAPDAVNWDLWLGTAQHRQFAANVYHPGNWRKLIDFGTGTLGDMGVHIFDTPYAALELTAPKWVKTTCRPPTGLGHPERNVVEYEFPGTSKTTQSLRWTWYDGADAPPEIGRLGLSESLELPGQGSLFVGEQGTMLLPHVGAAKLYPTAKFADFRPPTVDNGNHYFEWVDACMGNGSTSAGFDYAGPLTEALLLGVVANRFPQTQLDWDWQKMQFSSHDQANQLLRRTYRSGFEVDGL
jgi:predicted dehydrogenase